MCLVVWWFFVGLQQNKVVVGFGWLVVCCWGVQGGVQSGVTRPPDFFGYYERMQKNSLDVSNKWGVETQGEREKNSKVGCFCHPPI